MTWDSRERREFYRASVPYKIKIFCGDSVLESTTENISIGGMKVILGRRFSPFDEVNLELFLGEEESIKLKGKVVWMLETKSSTANSYAMFNTGIQFVDMSDEDRQRLKKAIVSFIDTKGAGR